MALLIVAARSDWHERLGIGSTEFALRIGQPMPDGRKQEPAGWNRFAIEVSALEGTVEKLRKAGVRFRNEIVTGVGGKQILVEDPSDNPIELFEPTRSRGSSRPADNTLRALRDRAGRDTCAAGTLVACGQAAKSLVTCNTEVATPPTTSGLPTIRLLSGDSPSTTPIS